MIVNYFLYVFKVQIFGFISYNKNTIISENIIAEGTLSNHKMNRVEITVMDNVVDKHSDFLNLFGKIIAKINHFNVNSHQINGE